MVKKKWKKAVVMLLAASLLTASVPGERAKAKEQTYIAKATPYYKHPVTGKIEDPGNNEGLGQSMTESVLHPKALLEETAGGKTYATIRIFLTDNITNIRLWTQKRSQTDKWTRTSAVIMQENMNGKYCSDYRFLIPEKTAIVRMRFYVTPMGRDVVFYIGFSNWKSGKGDFITSGSSTKSGTASQDESSGNSGSSTKSGAASQSGSSGNSGSSTTNGTASQSGNGGNSTTNGTASQGESSGNSGSSTKSGTVSRSGSDGKSTENGTDALGETGEELVENAQGLTMSSEDLLPSPGTGDGQGMTEDSGQTSEAASGETGQDSDDTLGDAGTGSGEISSSDQESDAAYTMRISWTLVLQCILIITVPPMCILLGGGYFFYRLHRREREEAEEDED